MSSFTKKLVSLLMTAIFLAAGLGLTRSLGQMRKDFGMTRLPLAEQARPDLLTSVLTSVGRALLVDYLWIGLQGMQQEGRYFDAMQRADWICKLQPHFPSVWVFHSWNMAYNISVAMTTPEERWHWVRQGYELLRDEGIPRNPKSVALYYQLAWIFEHKIGALSDDFHWYYKIQLARSIEPIVGSPDTGEYYALMAEAPRTWGQLLDVPEMKSFITALEGFKIDARHDYLKVLKQRAQYGEKVQALLDDPKYASCQRLLEGFLRAEWLRRDWKLDIGIIEKLRRDDMYGPLDFRVPEAHAIYWGYKGLASAGGADVTFDGLSYVDDTDEKFVVLNTKRVIYAALQDIVRRGRFVIAADGSPIITPDLRFVSVANRAYLAIGKAHAKRDGIEWDGTAGKTLRSGHVNFLRKVVALFYQYGDEARAREYWDLLNKLYPNSEYRVGMKEYVYQYVMKDVGERGMVDVNATVTFFLMLSFQQYAVGDDYSAVAMQRMAKIIYQGYTETHHKWRDKPGRMVLSPYAELKENARRMVLRRLTPELAERLRRRLGLTETPESVPPK